MMRFIGTVLLVTITFGAGVYLEKRYDLYHTLRMKYFPHDAAMSMENAPAQQAMDEPEILYWVAPMDPNFRRDKPGKSPMGMDLIPVYKGDDADDDIVRISPEVINNIGVRTERVQRGRFTRPIHTVGYVEYDETKISHIHLRVEGWINRLIANAEGERVKQGQLLFTLYSPALVNAQQEYLQVLARNNQRLIEASKEKLAALGLNKSQITALKDRGKAEQYLGIHAPQSGVITNLNVREGIFVKPEDNIMSIASLDTVWMQAEIFEQQANWVREGQVVEATLPSSPGKKWIGTVDYVYPELDAMTRTLRVRLKFNNPDEYLKPNMYAYVSIINEHTEPVLHVNREALILDGNYPRVILALGDGRFQPRRVTVGMVNDERAEIIDGLTGEERVVTSSQFLIDSEASLMASLQRMTPVPEEEAMASAIRTVKGQGIINTVDPEARSLNISHEPIPQIDWPAMTMDIGVAGDINLERVAGWKEIRFYMMKDESGTYYIRRIEPVKPATEDES